MRIALVTQWFPPEKAAIPADIATGLAALGHEVSVVTGFPNYPAGVVYPGFRQAPRRDSWTGSHRLRRVALYPSHDASPVRRAANYLSFAATSATLGWSVIRTADVVYVYHPPLTAVTGPWLSRALGGAPFVLHVQDLWPDSVVESGLLGGRASRSAGAVLARACNAVYRRAGAVVAIAPTMARTLVERGVAPEQTHVVPNWADEEFFRPEPRDESAVRELGAERCFTVMFAGNLGDLQALDVAVRAAARVRDLANFRLLFVGTGVAEPQLRALADEIGATNVRFHGSRPVAAMSRLTSAADVHLVSLRALPFFEGTIPSKLASLMASGLPVICAVAGDAARVVIESGCGWTCPPEDVEALEAVFRLAYASTSEQRQECGRAARDHYEQHMSRAAGVAALASVLVSASGLSTGEPVTRVEGIWR